MLSDMRIEFFDIEICAIEELFIIIIIIILWSHNNTAYARLVIC